MEMTVVNLTNQVFWSEYESLFLTIAKKTFSILEVSEEVAFSVIFVDSQKMEEINTEYRQVNSPTDVLSFALNDVNSQFDFCEDNELGDIFINIMAVVKQANQYQHSEKREVAFLFTHGLLHLLGFDHLTENEEQAMIKLQDEILEGIVSR